MKNKPADPVIGDPAADQRARPVTPPSTPATPGTRPGGDPIAGGPVGGMGGSPSGGLSQPGTSRPGQSGQSGQPGQSGQESSAAERAKQVANAATATARSTAEDMSSRVEGMAEETVDNVLSAAHERIDEAQGTVKSYVGSIGRAFGAASDSLEEDGLNMAATYVRAASNGLRQAAEEVEGVNTHAITGSVERYARSNPMLTVGGMALVGFVLTSILRGSRR